MAQPSPVREVESLIPHNITPFRSIGRRGGGFRLPSPSRGLRVGKSVQAPPAPQAPKPAPATAPKPTPATPAPLTAGLARRIPKTGQAQSLRSAMEAVVGPENARYLDAQPADIQRLHMLLSREEFNGRRVNMQNHDRDHLRELLNFARANRPASPQAARARNARGKAALAGAAAVNQQLKATPPAAPPPPPAPPAPANPLGAPDPWGSGPYKPPSV